MSGNLLQAHASCQIQMYLQVRSKYFTCASSARYSFIHSLIRECTQRGTRTGDCQFIVPAQLVGQLPLSCHKVGQQGTQSGLSPVGGACRTAPPDPLCTWSGRQLPIGAEAWGGGICWQRRGQEQIQIQRDMLLKRQQRRVSKTPRRRMWHSQRGSRVHNAMCNVLQCVATAATACATCNGQRATSSSSSSCCRRRHRRRRCALIDSNKHRAGAMPPTHTQPHTHTLAHTQSRDYFCAVPTIDSDNATTASATAAQGMELELGLTRVLGFGLGSGSGHGLWTSSQRGLSSRLWRG